MLCIFVARPSEILNMHVANVMFHEWYIEVTTNGKTGIKALMLVHI